MPELKSKKSGKTWKDAQSFYNDYIQADPSAKSHSPDDLWEAARTSGGYDFADDAPQPVATQPPPTATPGKPFSLGNMLYNLPSSFMKQGKEMLVGAGEILRNSNPNFMSDPGTLASKMARGESLPGPTQIIKAVKDDYANFYGGGNFLSNLEKDPARVAADAASLIPIIGWGAKAAGMAKTAKVLNKIATVADLASSPIPMAAEVVGRAPMLANKLAKKSMTYALKLPADTAIEAGEKLRDFALKEKIPMSMKGRSQAKKGFEQSNRDMKALEIDATDRGVDIDPNNIRSIAHEKVRHGNEGITPHESEAIQMVDSIIDDPKNYASGPVSPIHAAGVRSRVNASSKPKPNTINTEKRGLESQAFLAVGDATRKELGRNIPGHRDAAIRAMNFHDAYEAADRVQRALRNSSVIDHSQTGAMGASVGNVFTGNVVSPVVAGTAMKILHTPERVSQAAIKIYSKSPTSLRRLDLKTRKPAQYGGQALKQVGKPNPLRPFAEDDEQKQVNPLRPFPEE
mgnify:CR=1 FL=1